MKNLLLGIIAINLTIISINMTLRSVEPVNAQYSSSLQRVEICSGSSFDLTCLEVHDDVGNWTHIHTE
jgi:hypothetical protein